MNTSIPPNDHVDGIADAGDHLTRVKSGSGRRVALGAIATGAVNIIKVVLQLLLLPVMARLLGPDEFGLYALALPTISLFGLLADGGLGATLAREHEASSLVWSSAFWALLTMGILLAAISSLFGSLLGYLANQPRLPGMIALLSLSLVFLTMSVIPGARLARRKQLSVGAGAELISTVAGAVTAIVMAWYGAGAWSLAVQYVVTYACRAIILNIAGFHFPRAKFSFAALRPHLISGGIMIATRFTEYAGRVGENFVFDRIFTTQLLGNYTFANQVAKFATDAGANVVWAALFVQALTGDREKIAVLHRRLCRLLGITLFPTMFLAAAAAPELVDILLGPKWTDLAFLLRIFLPLLSFSVICAQAAPILLAYGRFDIQFWCIFGLSVGRVLAVVLGFWIGLDGTIYGIVAVTLGFCAAMLIVPSRITGCLPLPMLAGLVLPFLSSLVAVGVFFAIANGHTMDTLRTFIALGAGFLAYLAVMFAVDRRNLLQDWVSIRAILSRKELAP
jgi:O-antigen/teichoic acid export membrane protein